MLQTDQSNNSGTLRNINVIRTGKLSGGPSWWKGIFNALWMVKRKMTAASSWCRDSLTATKVQSLPASFMLIKAQNGIKRRFWTFFTSFLIRLVKLAFNSRCSWFQAAPPMLIASPPFSRNCSNIGLNLSKTDGSQRVQSDEAEPQLK